MSYQPTVVFDFDGVIHSYKSGWKGAGIIPDPVVPGIVEAIDHLRVNGYKVVVVSTRCSTSEGKEAVEVYLTENRIAVDGVMAEKPPALCYVDDRAICFDGHPEILLERVKSFKTWLQKESQAENLHNELCKAAEPLLKFLNDHYDPHAYAIVTEGRVEIVRGEISAPLPVRD